MGARTKGYFEGRLLKAASNREVLQAPNLFTRNELSKLHLSGKPLFYEHHKEKGQIGKIVTNFVDPEGYLVVGCQLDLATELGKLVYKAIKEKQLNALSVGLDHTDPNQTSVTSAEELYKDIIETSVTANPKFKDALIHSCFAEETRSLLERLLPYTQICDIKMAQQPTTPTNTPAPAAPNTGAALKRKEPELPIVDDSSDGERPTFDLSEAAKKPKDDLLRDLERFAQSEQKRAKKLRAAQKQLEESKEYKQQAAELAELKNKKIEKYATKHKDLYEEMVAIAKEEKVDADPNCAKSLQNLCGNPDLKSTLKVFMRMRTEGMRLAEENKKLKEEMERIAGDAKATGYALDRINQKKSAAASAPANSATKPASGASSNPWLSHSSSYKFDQNANRMTRTEASDKGDPLGVGGRTGNQDLVGNHPGWAQVLLQGRDAGRYNEMAANTKFNPFVAGKNQ